MSAAELKPCPMCGDPMRNKHGLICHAVPGDCIIGALSFDEGWIYRWNRRSDEAYATRIASLEARVAELTRVLELYADDGNWLLEGRFDPKSHNFNGTSTARATLAKEPRP